MTDVDLLSYLEESLAPADMARIEQALRADAALAQRLAALAADREAGSHSVGAIWRRHRLSCPSRSRLGSFLLGVLGEQEAWYIRTHVDEVGCRICRANLDDLRNQPVEPAPAVAGRRTRYFQSSVGRLPANRKP
ncbi:MAG TPA: hypothetical protein VG713_04875 [Pirellulales bacterium]|nr:hypothetical protein [Pirellulales bacterium]